MQKFFLVLAVILVTVTGFSQQEKYELGVNQQYNTNDTTRTFPIISGNLDQIKNILTERFGNPEGSEGVLIWKRVEIPGLNKKVTLMLYDGIATFEEDVTTIVYKNIDVDKSNLKENQVRCVDIRVLTKRGKIVVNTLELEILVKEAITNILNKKDEVK